MTQWWEPFYDDLLATMLLEQRSTVELEESVTFLVDVLGLAPGARVFDQCCGIGQLALAFAARGHDVVAVDQAKGYVERARKTPPSGASRSSSTPATPSNSSPRRAATGSTTGGRATATRPRVKRT
jgi:2-polyprenyl-3-methyl-5-hydroxy-6-metoxy-1,4-benzoquinol methylase